MTMIVAMNLDVISQSDIEKVKLNGKKESKQRK